jgi:hypothetical protein
MNRDDQVVDPNQVHKVIQTLFKSYEEFIKKLHKRKMDLMKERFEIEQKLKLNAEEKIRLEQRLAKIKAEESAIDKMLSMFHGKKVDGKYLDANTNTFVDKKPQDEAINGGKDLSPQEKTNEIYGFLESKKGEEFYEAEIINEIKVDRKNTQSIDSGINISSDEKMVNEISDSFLDWEKKAKDQSQSNDSQLPSVNDWEKSLSEEQRNFMTLPGNSEKVTEECKKKKSQEQSESFNLYKKFSDYTTRIKVGASMTGDLLKGKEMDQEKFNKFYDTLSPADKKRVDNILVETGNGMPGGKGDPKEILNKAFANEKKKIGGIEPKALDRIVEQKPVANSRTKLTM